MGITCVCRRAVGVSQHLDGGRIRPLCVEGFPVERGQQRQPVPAARPRPTAPAEHAAEPAAGWRETAPIPPTGAAWYLCKRQPATGCPPPADCRQVSPAGAVPAAHSKGKSRDCRKAGRSSRASDPPAPVSRQGPDDEAEAPSPPERALPCPARSWTGRRECRCPGTGRPDSSPAGDGPGESAARRSWRPSSDETPQNACSRMEGKESAADVGSRPRLPDCFFVHFASSENQIADRLNRNTA